MRSILKAGFIATLLALMWPPESASALGAPKGAPILEIAGNIQEKNRGNVAVFDREMLESMGLQTIVTTTPWDNGPVRFEGVPLSKLMAEVKAQGKTVRVLALNDYVTLIPMEDFAKHGVILAIKRDGKYMPIREKGPLFVIYPFDSNPALQSQVYYARSAWQVKRIEVEQ